MSGATWRRSVQRVPIREHPSAASCGRVLPEIGSRPVVVLSRDVAIARLGRTLIAPCTTTIRGLPSEVLLEPGVDPVPRPCAVNLDSVESVSLGVLVDRLGRLSDERMRAICDALSVAVDCH